MQLKIESFRNCFSGLFIFINFHLRVTSLIHLLDDTAQNFIPRKLRYRAKEIMSCTDNCAKETTAARSRCQFGEEELANCAKQPSLISVEPLGPFLESPDNFTGPKPCFKILKKMFKNVRIIERVLAQKAIISI